MNMVIDFFQAVGTSKPGSICSSSLATASTTKSDFDPKPSVGHFINDKGRQISDKFTSPTNQSISQLKPKSQRNMTIEEHEMEFNRSRLAWRAQKESLEEQLQKYQEEMQMLQETTRKALQDKEEALLKLKRMGRIIKSCASCQETHAAQESNLKKDKKLKKREKQERKQEKSLMQDDTILRCSSNGGLRLLKNHHGKRRSSNSIKCEKIEKRSSSAAERLASIFGGARTNSPQSDSIHVAKNIEQEGEPEEPQPIGKNQTWTKDKRKQGTRGSSSETTIITSANSMSQKTWHGSERKNQSELQVLIDDKSSNLMSETSHETLLSKKSSLGRKPDYLESIPNTQISREENIEINSNTEVLVSEFEKDSTNIQRAQSLSHWPPRTFDAQTEALQQDFQAASSESAHLLDACNKMALARRQKLSAALERSNQLLDGPSSITLSDEPRPFTRSSFSNKLPTIDDDGESVMTERTWQDNNETTHQQLHKQQQGKRLALLPDPIPEAYEDVKNYSHDELQYSTDTRSATEEEDSLPQIKNKNSLRAIRSKRATKDLHKSWHGGDDRKKINSLLLTSMVDKVNDTLLQDPDAIPRQNSKAHSPKRSEKQVLTLKSSSVDNFATLVKQHRADRKTKGESFGLKRPPASKFPPLKSAASTTNIHRTWHGGNSKSRNVDLGALFQQFVAEDQRHQQTDTFRETIAGQDDEEDSFLPFPSRSGDEEESTEASVTPRPTREDVDDGINQIITAITAESLSQLHRSSSRNIYASDPISPRHTTNHSIAHTQSSRLEVFHNSAVPLSSKQFSLSNSLHGHGQYRNTNKPLSIGAGQSSLSSSLHGKRRQILNQKRNSMEVQSGKASPGQSARSSSISYLMNLDHRRNSKKADLDLTLKAKIEMKQKNKPPRKSSSPGRKESTAVSAEESVQDISNGKQLTGAGLMTKVLHKTTKKTTKNAAA